MQAIGNLKRYLKPGGLLLISRNVGPEADDEHGSVWRKSGEGFELVDEFGGGSEVRHLVFLVGERTCAA